MWCTSTWHPWSSHAICMHNHLVVMFRSLDIGVEPNAQIARWLFLSHIRAGSIFIATRLALEIIRVVQKTLINCLILQVTKSVSFQFYCRSRFTAVPMHSQISFEQNFKMKSKVVKWMTIYRAWLAYHFRMVIIHANTIIHLSGETSRFTRLIYHRVVSRSCLDKMTISKSSFFCDFKTHAALRISSDWFSLTNSSLFYIFVLLLFLKALLDTFIASHDFVEKLAGRPGQLRSHWRCQGSQNSKSPWATYKEFFHEWKYYTLG